MEHVLDVGMIESFLECFCYAVVINEFLTGKAYEESLIRADFQRLQCLGITGRERGENWNQLLIVAKRVGQAQHQSLDVIVEFKPLICGRNRLRRKRGSLREAPGGLLERKPSLCAKNRRRNAQGSIGRSRLIGSVLRWPSRIDSCC